MLTEQQLFLIKLKYSQVEDLDSLINEYFDYLKHELDEDELVLTFDEWYFDYLEDQEFFASDEWQQEQQRLSEKD
jgi:hypothetical protein